MKRWHTWALATLAAGGLGVLDAPLQPMSGAAEAADGEVAIHVFSFKPSPLSIAKGTTVTWTNGDDITHTVTSGAPGKKDARFEGRLDGKGASYRHTFTEAGTYQYYCARHQAMAGEIVVK